MMENFRKKFLEEAADHVAEMENSLLLLEKDHSNKELIEQIFRAMHTIKGGGAMFGYNKMSKLTHDLETIYDYIRSEKIPLHDEILNLTYDSIDLLKILIAEDENNTQETLDNHTTLLQKIHTAIASIEKPTAHTAKKIAKTAINNTATYYIHFSPHENIMDNGTNPLYLLDELCSLGLAKTIPFYNKIPDLCEFNLVLCYLHWEIILATTKDISAIHDVFLFVEDSCDLEIIQIAEANLFDIPGFANKLHDIAIHKQDVGMEEIVKIAEELQKNTGYKKNTTGNNANRKNKENGIASIRVASEKLDQLMNMVSELVTVQARLSLYSQKNENPELLTISENIQKLTRQLRDLTFSVVLIPVETMLTRFQRLVRDLSKELNKQIEFTAEGTETELDKNIIT